MGWFDSIEHSRWLSRQLQELLEHTHAAMTETGFGYYTEQGTADLARPVDLAITARTTYVYSMGVLMGIPGSRKYCDHGVKAMARYFRDPVYGGWFTSIEQRPDEAGNGVPWGEKGAEKWQYAHSFLILAAAAAAVANRPGAHELLVEALENQEQYWLDDDGGLPRDRYSRDWETTADYRCLNSLLHTVEAYLAAAEAMHEPVWIDRAERMLRFVYGQAKRNGWRAPEHYNAQWQPQYDYSIEDPANPAHPYGVLVGHSMELARLALEARGALHDKGEETRSYLLELAKGLFDQARLDGWRANGKPGFIYSTDFAGDPVVEDHLLWVACEGVVASVVLRQTLLDDGADLRSVELYEHCYRSWLDYVNDYFVVAPGFALRQLNADNEITPQSEFARPDGYHLVQALLVTRLPVWPPFAEALSQNLLDKPTAPRRPTGGLKFWGR